MKARIKDFVVTYDGKQLVTFETRDDFREVYDNLKEFDLDVAVKKYRKKRSIDANAYAWVLIGKLAEAFETTADEIYKDFIKDYGIHRVIEINEEAVETMAHSWSLHGKGWFTEILDHGQSENTRLMRMYYGSSVYNTKQMSRLIDAIVHECKDAGIETMPTYELEALKARWGDA